MPDPADTGFGTHLPHGGAAVAAATPPSPWEASPLPRRCLLVRVELPRPHTLCDISMGTKST